MSKPSKRTAHQGLTCFKVGGAVRDALLGKPQTDVDWVVVGATSKELKSRGFQSVGKDFPVFLHPHTREEYALARTETKSGKGYKGFTFDASVEVRLEDDLARRDLTINAMAEAPDGTRIDPFHGARDLEAKVLRHIGPAFREDPLRVLRTARFRAKLDFSLAPETRALLEEMSQSGELEHLTPERVFLETEKALKGPRPRLYFETLQEVGALKVVFPELQALVGVEQPPEHHPEGDAFTHSLLSLEEATQRSPRPEVRFAALVHDLGKGLTPPELWPKHHGHDKAGVPVVEALCQRLRMPNSYRDLAVLVTREHMRFAQVHRMRAGRVVELLSRLKVRHGWDRIEDFLFACESDLCGREGYSKAPHPQVGFLLSAAHAVRAVQVRSGVQGKVVGELLHQDQVRVVKRVQSNYYLPETES